MFLRSQDITLMARPSRCTRTAKNDVVDVDVTETAVERAAVTKLPPHSECQLFASRDGPLGDAGKGSSPDESDVDTEDGQPCQVLHGSGAHLSPRQGAAAATCTPTEVAETVQQLLRRKTLPTVAARRRTPWAPHAAGSSVEGLPQSELLFENAGEDIIKFGSRACDSRSGSDTGSSQPELSEKQLRRRRRAKIDRDFDDAQEAFDAIEEENDESDEHDDTTSDVLEESSHASDSSSDSSADEPATENAVSRGFGAGRRPPGTQEPAALAGRHHFAGVTFECFYDQRGGAHHTLLGLTAPQTILGACAVFGIFGETGCGGFLLGQKCFIAEDKERFVLQPVPKLATSSSKLSDDEYRSLVQSKADTAASRLARRPWQPDSRRSWEHPNRSVAESRFGAIDWEWVAVTLQSWMGRLSADRSTMSVVLVVQPYRCGERMIRTVSLRRHAQHVDRYGASDSVDVPVCIARHRLFPEVEPALVPVFRTIVSGAQSVAVVGGQSIGKSTLARAFANAWLSQNGVCYWLDLDLGRPEFGVSGSLSVAAVRNPLRRPNDFASVELIKVCHVGGSRLMCPETMALALEHMSAFVLEHHSSWMKPLVINTHGWIESTGRRSTVEVLRRVNPQHVVQLTRHGDPKWVVPEVVYEPKRGLNRRVVQTRFSAGIPTRMPEAGGARNASSETAHMQVHSLTVVRLGSHAKAAATRRDNWRYYFASLLTVSPSARCKLRVPLSGALLVHPSDAVVNRAMFVSSISNAVIGIALASCPHTPGSKRQRDGEVLADDIAGPQPLNEVMASRTVDFIGYAFCSTSPEEAERVTEIDVLIPAAAAAVESRLSSGACKDRQQLVLLALPHEAYDTAFLRDEMSHE